MVSFIDFKRKLDKNIPEAWEKLRLNVVTVVNHWCREKYLEVSWTVKDGKVIKEQDFYQVVFIALQNDYNAYKLNINEYADLKNIFTGIAQKILSEGFREFLSELSLRNENAWKILDAKLRVLIKSWLIKKGDSSNDSFQAIYCDALSNFVEKNTAGKLKFEDSKKLKSYFLSVAENKRKEYYRLKNSNRCEPFDIQKADMPYEFSLPLDEKQRNERLKLNINQLNHNERTIIYGVFFYKMMLKDIAVALDISEEACRVTKLRALRKLQELYSQVTA